MIKNLLKVGVLLLFVSFAACKKELPNNPVEPIRPIPEPVESTKEEHIKDSVFYYTKLLSLWQDHMPPRVLNDIEKEGVIRSYTKSYATGQDVLSWMVSLTPPDSITGAPIDRYSFLDRAGVVSDEIQNAVATSYGMQLFYLGNINEDNAYLYVKMVDRNSSAYLAGLRRGDRLISIDGKTGIDFNTQQAENFKTVNTALSANSMVISFVTPSGKITEGKELTSTPYSFNPVQASIVLNHNGKKIGYLAFSSFVNVDEGSGHSAMHTEFERIFTDFEAQQITELVVDLRYNGGGAVLTAEYLANRIAPIAADNQLMYSYSINNTLKGWGWLDEGDEFAPVKYKKLGSLTLPKVYFLVTKETASASELLMNSLMPYMDVVLIGTKRYNEQSQLISENTYGKPVGFFGLEIVDENIELFVSSFKTFNSKGVGDYFGGLVPDHHVEEFTNFVDFGESNEPMLAAALNLIDGKPITARSEKLAARRNGNMATAHARIAAGLKANRNVDGMYKFKKQKLNAR